MSDYDRCATCGEYDWVNSHKCPPMWEVYCPDEGDADDARTFYAVDEEAAVEKWAQRSDSHGEYSIARGNDTPTVRIRRLGAAEWEEWEVSGETVPEYTATRKTARPAPDAKATEV